MSAIFGILRFDGGAVSPREMERLGVLLAHRGVDGRKFVANGAIGLGHGLTRVTREDLLEAQPLLDRDDDLTLVADIRLDNRDELAAALGCATELQNLPDSALALRAYKRWGADFAEHLLGDFAIAVWDGRTKKLILVRDHMGQRYVHFHHGKDFFVFATDIKALWALDDVPRILSEAHIGRTLLSDLSARDGQTPFEDIEGLIGATVLTVGVDGVEDRRRYWEPHADPKHIGRDEAYYVAAYRRVLGEAVSCRIRRTLRPPGMFFSGGYDSAAIAGLAAPALAVSGHRLVGAASVMPQSYRGTIRHARPWVEMCARDMPHLDVRYVTREGKNALSGLERSFLDTGLPAAPALFATQELLGALAGAGVRAILDGHGGDYTLNPRGEGALARSLKKLQLRRFVFELRGHMRLTGRSLWMTLTRDIGKRLLPPSLQTAWKRAGRGSMSDWRAQPIAKAFAERLIADGVVEERNLVGAAAPLRDGRQGMVAALRRAMARSAPGIGVFAALQGLELTRPYLDKRVVELALAIPPELDVKGGRNRYLACRALADLYPREFQSRWRKNDDEIPDFQRMAKSIEPELLAEIARMERSESLTRYVDFEKVRALLATRGADDHESGWEPQTHLAVHGILVARYIEWFRRRNR